MADLFDGFKKMDDDEIKVIIALLKNVTLYNAAKETSNRIIGGLADFANAIIGTVSKKAHLDYEIVKVSDMVRKEIEEMNGKERVQLDYELRMILIDKCKETAPELVNLYGAESLNSERISFIIINEASKIFSISKYDTPSDKVEKITEQYKEILFTVIHDRLKRQSEAEVKSTNDLIQKSMNEVPLEDKRMLQQSLLPKEFSGNCIGRILRLEKGTKYLSETIKYLGYDAFDYIFSNVTAVYTNIRPFKGISKILFAQIVWSARNANANSYVINEKILPSYIKPEERQDVLNKDKEFRKLLQSRIDNEKIYKEKEDTVEKQQKKLFAEDQKYILIKRELEEAQMGFMSLESKKDEFFNRKKPENETKEYFNEVNEAKRRLDKAENDETKEAKLIEELKKKIQKAYTDKSIAELNLKVSKSKTEKIVIEMTENLKRKWRAFYFNLPIKDELYEKIVVEYTIEQRLKIEKMIKEIQGLKDRRSYSYSKEGENFITYCEVATGKNVKIEYDILKGIVDLSIAK